MTIKYLVTGGCSFSDNIGLRWPHYLSKALNLKLNNRGQGSCGNDWISKSVIYQIYQLLNSDTKPEEILVVVMWSGIDRKSLFVNEQDTINFNNLLNLDRWNMNRINFIDSEPNNITRVNNIDGYVVGSASCKFKNNIINEYKKNAILDYFPNESLAIESYENFLRLQWFCSSYNIKLYNLTAWNIMIYPESFVHPKLSKLTKDIYRNVTHLYDLIDFNKWIFWNDYGGLYEYTRDNKLTFYSDNVHPSPESHNHYVQNFLTKNIKL